MEPKLESRLAREQRWHIRKDPDAGKYWKQEKKGTTKYELVGWDHWFNGHKFEQALGVVEAQGTSACCSPSFGKESDTTEGLNWTKLYTEVKWAGWQYTALRYSFPNLEPVHCSMSSSNCCFLSCIHVSQGEDKVACYSHVFKNFPQFVVSHMSKVLV